MKPRTFLFTPLLCISLLSCVEDLGINTLNEQSDDLIVGEWLFISQHDYRCGTDEVITERPATDNESIYTKVFYQDGTYEDFYDGLLSTVEEQSGTWKNIGNGIYQNTFSVNGEDIAVQYRVEFFDNNNSMKFNITECFGRSGLEFEIYTYSILSRQL